MAQTFTPRPARATQASVDAIAPPGNLRAIGRGEFVYNLVHYGAVRGSSDANATANDAAWTAMMADIPAISDSYGGVAYSIFIPAGIFKFSGGLAIPSGKRCRIEGAGNYSTLLIRKTAATGDFMTISSPQCELFGFCIDMNQAADQAGGDALVLNANKTVVRDVYVANSCADGIVVGKTARALGTRMDSVSVYNARGYGVKVPAGNNSTDCEFDRVSTGMNGKSGFYIAEAATNLELCHSWGNGIWDSADNDGFRILSTGIRMSNCEAETNLGAGITVRTGSDRVQIIGGRYWGNMRQGIFGISAKFGVISGATVAQNGVANTNTSGSSFAGIVMDSCTGWSITGTVSQEFAAAIPAGGYTITPTYPYPGRTAVYTQSQHYVETGTTDKMVLTGNMWKPEDTSSGIAATIIGPNNIYGANNMGQPPTLNGAPMVSGKWYSRPFTGSSTGSAGNGVLRMGRLPIDRPVNLNGIGIEVATAGSAGALVRLGIYSYNAITGAVALLLDAGTIDATVTGFQSITINYAVRFPTQVLLGAVIQGAPTAEPLLRIGSGVDPALGSSTGSFASANPLCGFNSTGVTGALPATPSLAETGGPYKVLVKAA